jgi:hypothetical protein
MSATNSLGWEIQQLKPTGWEPITKPFPTRDEACEELWAMKPPAPGVTYRVYEALEHKGKA